VTSPAFFHLAGVPIADQACQGTACFVARHRDRDRWAGAEGTEPRIYCLGRCYQAPAVATDDAPVSASVDAPEPVILRRIASGGDPSLAAYRRDGGYAALERALAMTPESVVDEMDASALRGRGGAAFPVGRKWRAARSAVADQRFVVVNADEGDAGAYIDRVLLEADPHVVLEGLAIAALAVGASAGYVYVRKEYPLARARIESAVAEAYRAGILGDHLLGDGPPLRVVVAEGEGSYVCGEETALLNALEGRRPHVRPRPPFPAERGLWGRPTIVNNVETLAAVPWIITNGGAAHAAIGTATSAGTKVVSLSSLFRRPGLYEVELGLPVRDVVERLGGGLVDGELRGVLIGGPLAGVLPPDLLDTPLAFDELRQVGCEVGHGGIVAFDEHTSIAELVHHVVRFGAFESCGACTPCRLGTARLESLLHTALAGEPAPSTAREWHEIVHALAATSLCGHGTGIAAFARSIEVHYREELERWLT
jgi:NADH:ubiquinone oxidoreductase subunit F (NADH-binding)